MLVGFNVLVVYGLPTGIAETACLTCAAGHLTLSRCTRSILVIEYATQLMHFCHATSKRIKLASH